MLQNIYLQKTAAIRNRLRHEPKTSQFLQDMWKIVPEEIARVQAIRL